MPLIFGVHRPCRGCRGTGLMPMHVIEHSDYYGKAITHYRRVTCVCCDGNGIVTGPLGSPIPVSVKTSLPALVSHA